MKVLNFMFRGKPYRVNELGQIYSSGTGKFSKNWIFRGGIPHHWGRYVKVTLKDAFENPKLLNGCMAADIDHGTFRIWGGSYNGSIPRIRGAYVSNCTDEP